MINPDAGPCKAFLSTKVDLARKTACQKHHDSRSLMAMIGLLHMLVHAEFLCAVAAARRGFWLP